MVEMNLPCVLSIQTGINEPRYVGIRGIRKASSLEIPVHNAEDLGISPASVGRSGAKVRRLDYFVPERGQGARMLAGSADEIMDQLIEILRMRGGLK